TLKLTGVGRRDRTWVPPEGVELAGIESHVGLPIAMTPALTNVHCLLTLNGVRLLVARVGNSTPRRGWPRGAFHLSNSTGVTPGAGRGAGGPSSLQIRQKLRLRSNELLYDDRIV